MVGIMAFHGALKAEGVGSAPPLVINRHPERAHHLILKGVTGGVATNGGDLGGGEANKGVASMEGWR